MNPSGSRGFASDNNAGVHPALLEAIQKANTGHTVAYGDDEYTKRAVAAIRRHFGSGAEVFFVLTGTGANVLGLSAITDSFDAVICAETAHIQVDECGAPEKFCNCKLIPVPTPDGKITPGLVKPRLQGFGFDHVQ
jgi:threonine aldolase